MKASPNLRAGYFSSIDFNQIAFTHHYTYHWAVRRC